MAEQFLTLVEETTRGTDPGSGYLYLPVTGALQPTFNAKDEPRQEFRGNDSALGALSASIVRRESQWTHTIECPYYPGAETGLLFKHLLGKAGTRNTVDTSGKKGILYPLSQPFGTGRELANKAIGLWITYDKEGVAKKRYFGGGRIKSCTIKIEGTDDVKLSFEVQGPGEYIGAEAAGDLTPTFPTATPFVSADCLAYIGAGITRTGTAPDFTALAPNTMAAFAPDSWTITITGGLDDKIVMNGVLGPSKTIRAGQFGVEVACPTDLSDPTSGFSSADEYDAIFSGASTNSLLIVLQSAELAGDTNTYYNATIDLPALLRKHETPARNSEGQQPTVNLNFQSLYSTTTDYPLALLTTDKAAAY